MTTHILVPDVHAPFHSKPAVNLAVEVIGHVQPNSINQVGDLVDHESVNPHGRKREHALLTIKQEVRAGREILARFAAAAPKAKRRYIKGNHELWWPRHLDKNPAHADAEDCDIGEVAAADGWEVTEYGDNAPLGPNLVLTHDAGSAGKTAFLTAANTLGTSVAFGHTHSAGCYYSSTLNGKQRLGAALGWLGDPQHAKYRQKQLKRREWTWGVGLVHLSPKGLFAFNYLPFIRDGRRLTVCVEGKWLSVRL